MSTHTRRVSCQKGPTRHAYASQIGPFWQYTLELLNEHTYPEGILPKGPYPPCLRMADRALLAGYPRITQWAHVPGSNPLYVMAQQGRDEKSLDNFEVFMINEKPWHHVIQVFWNGHICIYPFGKMIHFDTSTAQQLHSSIYSLAQMPFISQWIIQHFTWRSRM